MVRGQRRGVVPHHPRHGVSGSRSNRCPPRKILYGFAPVHRWPCRGIRRTGFGEQRSTPSPGQYRGVNGTRNSHHRQMVRGHGPYFAWRAWVHGMSSKCHWLVRPAKNHDLRHGVSGMLHNRHLWQVCEPMRVPASGLRYRDIRHRCLKAAQS